MAAILPYLRLLRAGTLFSPGADVVAGLCVLGLPWSGSALRAVVASVCLYAAGMVWNDVADRKQDAIARPERPLPRGDLPLGHAVLLGVLLLAAGLWLSPCRLHHGVIAALVLAYDFALKRVAWLGALAMGTLRGLNLATALALAGPAGPEPASGSWPTALRVAAVCYGLYIAAVTVLGILEDAARVRRRDALVVQVVPPLAALTALCAVCRGGWWAPALALLPAARFLHRIAGVDAWDQRTIRRSMVWLLLGTMLFTALLCAASERIVEALLVAACIWPARWISRHISLT